MLDITVETPINLTDVARMRPAGRGNRPTHFGTVLRWILNGVKTPNGRVKLQAVRLRSKWVTSKEAVQRFTDALTRPYLEVPTAVPPRLRAARQRAADQAARALDKLGI